MDLKELYPRYGQSLWLDYIRRHLLTSGEFERLVREDGIRGVTANPSLFEKAIAGSTDYDAVLERIERRKDETPVAIYEQLAVEDIQSAADILRPVYDDSERRDGFACLEVSPYLAHDTQGSIDEARRLWKAIRRENVMIKIPATPEGLPAIQQLLGEGINVNITLLFSRAVCRQVFEAYMAGLEAFAGRDGDLGRIASVASMFVSRIDVLVNPILEARGRAVPAKQATFSSLVGAVAIANARLAYQDWKEACRGPRWRALAGQGAPVQRLLWASTGTKDPRFSDVLYVESLIGPDTVNTVPPATLDAFRDHGTAGSRIEEDIEHARRVIETLANEGISLEDVTSRLLDEGVKAFSASFDNLLGSIEKKRARVLQPAFDRMSHRLPEPLQQEVEATLDDWRREGKVRRLWARDASLWTGRDEGKWLDWLQVADKEHDEASALLAFAQEARRSFTHAVVLGMGGSSLCPDVLSRTFARPKGYPELLVLDSTDPAQIRTLESRIDLTKTLFIVSSKSGTTLEPNLLTDYFCARVRRAVGEAKVGSHFIAVTDPGSALEKAAAAQGFAKVWFGAPGIGGRYSALSDFGMAPAAIMGVDVPRFVDRAGLMVHACASCVPPRQNPGVLLGSIIGVLADKGRDKLTLVASPGIMQLGAWLEQLLAESTGKAGKGVIPIDREPLGSPDVYGGDRLFVYLRLASAPDAVQDAAMDALEKAGQPVVRIALADAWDLGQEFFRWEIATAVAGAVLGINPFDQPDVEGSKVAARSITDAYDRTGSLPREDPFYRDSTFALFADERNHVALEEAAGADRTLRGYLRAHLARLRPGDYFALLAYVERSDAHHRVLQAIRRAVRDSRRVATCLGFGPRFLHSTGQAYKGGPNTGVFLQLTCEEDEDLPIPGHRSSFGVVKAAQARGDFRVLVERGRRVLRVHLGADVRAGLDALAKTIGSALS